MSMIKSSISKAVRSVSANAAANDYKFKNQAMQDFQAHFWEAFAARSARRCNYADLEVNERSLPKDKHYPLQETKEEFTLRKCTREDLYRHFRMSAASRAMKRGDGILSRYFSLDQTSQAMHRYELANAMHTELPSLIDVATARKAREEMHHHFWSSRRLRKEVTHLTTMPTSLTSNHDDELHKHRFKLPTTLDDAYTEFRSIGSKSTQLSQRPMAITEMNPPFKIVEVNKAWEKLCGYSREAAVDSTLKELLQGPKTNIDVAKKLTESLLHQDDGNPEHEAVLVNYRSDGRQFKNHVRVGPIKNEAGVTTHFIGVFKKLSDEDSSQEDQFANM